MSRDPHEHDEDPPAGPRRSERSALSVIREIKEGTVRGAGPLARGPAAVRLAHLLAEGYAIPEVAEILGVSERTIQRDKKEIRAEAALAPDPDLAGEIAGQLVAQAEAACTAMARIARDSQTPAEVRLAARRAIWQVQREYVETIQSLGFLPTAPERHEAELRVGPIDDEQLAREIASLGRIVADARVSAGGEPRPILTDGNGSGGDGGAGGGVGGSEPCGGADGGGGGLAAVSETLANLALLESADRAGGAPERKERADAHAQHPAP